jgi:5'-methylthioadenosine phosphorylase
MAPPRVRRGCVHGPVATGSVGREQAGASSRQPKTERKVIREPGARVLQAAREQDACIVGEVAPSARIGILSSWFSDEFLIGGTTQHVQTPWGAAEVDVGEVDGDAVACIWRYGRELALPSHRINFRANLWALRLLGVERVISQNAIGSCNPDLPPGYVVVSDDFIDFTHSRPRSFFDDADAWVRVDLTEPFCGEVRQALIAAAGPIFGDTLASRGIFICSEGPRFETPAEIRMFRQWGADIIGTPLVPEVILAREAEMCFASIAPIINFASGLAPSVVHTGAGSMVDFYYGSGFHDRVEAAIRGALRALPSERGCGCGRALEGAFHGQPPAWFTPRH